MPPEKRLDSGSTDGRRRGLERRAAQGDADAAARLLAERIRAGDLPRARVALLARAGDPLAQRAVGEGARGEARSDLPALRQDLAAAVVWCSERGREDDPARSLRSGALAPGAFSPPWVAAVSQRVQDVEALGARRIDGLRAGGWHEGAAAHRLAGGRLLLFAPDDTLSDGAAAQASGGFFDVNDAPPWDTWLHYAVDGIPPGFWRGFRSYLVCWVPPALIAAAEAGVQANPATCLQWADGADLPFVRSLRGAGLLEG